MTGDVGSGSWLILEVAGAVGLLAIFFFMVVVARDHACSERRERVRELEARVREAELNYARLADECRKRLLEAQSDTVRCLALVSALDRGIVRLVSAETGGEVALLNDGSLVDLKARRVIYRASEVLDNGAGG